MPAVENLTPVTFSCIKSNWHVHEVVWSYSKESNWVSSALNKFVRLVMRLWRPSQQDPHERDASTGSRSGGLWVYKANRTNQHCCNGSMVWEGKLVSDLSDATTSMWPCAPVDLDVKARLLE
jgi:hypothetical protein